MSGMQIAQRSYGVSTRWAKALRLGALAGGLMVAGFGLGAPAAVAASTTTVDLGQASTYAVFSGLSVGNTVNAEGAPYTTLRGDLGVKPDAQPTGFPPGVVTGTTRVGTTAAAEAHADLVAAYDEVAGRTGGTPFAGDLAGLKLAPGLYSSAAAVSNTATLTLDGGGDPKAVFVFQIGGALTMAAGAKVTLTNGAKAANVFWQVNGAGGIGANAKFAGTLMALDAIGVGAGTEVNGRALARGGAVSLDSNEFYSVPPVVTIDGGATAITTDTTPTISGTTDVVDPEVVTVTIDGQTLTATPSSEGAWSVTSAILANGTYPVVASATDGAGNQTSTAQQLTVDTVLPVVTIDGGSDRLTNDPTPTISGTSDVAPGTTVRVSVSGQTLTALVQTGGTWNVTPATLTDATHTATASVSDPAGNKGTDSQSLTIDTTMPGLTVTGGADKLTNDPTPTISGTSDAASGASVTVTVSDQDLSGTVQSGGSWSVTAATLTDGPHRVIVSVSDAAGNKTTATQTLTVDTVAPGVVIYGGETVTTTDTTPTISGTSDAVPGTTVTVRLAGQTMTTLLQESGTWNATPSAVNQGTYSAIASVPDPAGNVGTDEQTLTVAGTEPEPTPTEPAPTEPAPTEPAPTEPAPTQSAPTQPAPEPTVYPAKLSVARVSVLRDERKLDVLAPITGRASGVVKAEFHAAGEKHRFQVKVDSENRRLRFAEKVSAKQSKMGTGILTLTYPGDANTLPQEVRLRAANGKAGLEAKRPVLEAGVLRASGTLSKRARGVVRVQVQWITDGQTHERELQAKISNGRYKLAETLDKETTASIANRTGALHSYTLFTGYLPERMRGEMKSYQIAP